MMTAEAIQEIAELAVHASAVEKIQIGERMYTDRAIHEVIQKEPEPALLKVHTLTGLRDYVNANKDTLALNEYLLHVVDPGQVDLISAVEGDYLQRLRYVSAVNYDRFAAVQGFAFGRYLDLEAMNIALQALFEDTQTRAALLRLIGSVTADANVLREDDGVTQKVTARAGVVMKESVEVPNPVILSPFRTFPEVDQPASPFVFRLRKLGDEVQAALYEADGGAWKNQAVEDVAAWLRSEVAAVTVIA